MGKYERTLTIDGDYFHLVSAGTGGRALFDRDPGKTVLLSHLFLLIV